MNWSPNMSLIKVFIAGSSNLQPEPVVQLNLAGPLISSSKNSSISGLIADVSIRYGLTGL